MTSTIEPRVPALERRGAARVTSVPADFRPGRSAGARIWKLTRRHPAGMAGVLLLVAFGTTALLAAQVAPYSPDATGLGESFAGPSRAHPFGLDQLGRDVLSRVIWGARVSFVTGLTSTGIALAVGLTLGVVSAYFGGLVDLVAQRVIEAINVFPPLVFALLLVAMFGQSTLNIITALAISMAPGMARLVRAAVLSVRGLPYIDAASALGASDVRIMTRHILPNIGGSVAVMGTLALGSAITAEASLAFLGIGGSPTSPSWGRMLAQATTEMIRHAPHLAYFPGLAITLVVLAVNFSGDAARDLFDPQARNRR